jgi:hypothetical protein
MSFDFCLSQEGLRLGLCTAKYERAARQMNFVSQIR